MEQKAMANLNGGARAPICNYQGVKVFSATKAKEREYLGEQITDWLRVSGNKVVDTVITQSSDSEFHCLTITVLYNFAG